MSVARFDRSRVASPSELSLSHLRWETSSLCEGQDVVVAGRVRAVGKGFELFDAFASVPLDLTVAEPDRTSDPRPLDPSDPPRLSDGDLAIIGATLAKGRLIDAIVIERVYRAPTGSRRADVTRLCDRGVARALRSRGLALRAVRALLDPWGFLEVETPTLVPCPGLDTHLDAFSIAEQDRRGPRFLTTSPEYQMKRLLVGGVPRCYQFAKSFRRGEIGARHNPEFTMLEWYRAFGSFDRIIADTEAIIVAVNDAIGTPEGSLARLDLRRPFPRITVTDAFATHAGVGEAEMLAMANGDEETFFRILVERIEPALAAYPTPVVLSRYPAAMASLARLCPDDARYAERFELYAAGVELCNGFGELTDPREQRERFVRDQRDRAERGLPVYPIDERFVASLEEGMPPSSGNALGFDRLVMLALGATEIGDVMAFPEGEI